ncbi:hypothetical protein [Methylobacterium sp. JK268]
MASTSGFPRQAPETSATSGGAIIGAAGTNGVVAIVGAATLGWARDNQPATNDAGLSGVSRLVATRVAVVLARVAAAVGWPLFWQGAACCGLMVTRLVVRHAFAEAQSARRP